MGECFLTRRGGTSTPPVGTSDWTVSNITNVTMQVFYSDGMWFACSASGGCYWSTDAKTWTLSNITTNAYSVISGNGKFVCVGGYSGGIKYSSDGKTFTATSITTGYYPESVICNNGIFHTYPSLFSSTNGTTWTNAGLGLGTKVVYGDGKWIFIGDTFIYYSVNGTSWTVSNIASGTSYSFNDGAYGNNIFVVAGNGQKGIYYSTNNGATWTVSNINSGNYDVVYGNGVFVATCLSGTSFPGTLYSTNGSTWTQSTTLEGNKVVFINGYFYLYTSNTNYPVYLSRNGIAWSTGYNVGKWLSNLASNGNTFCASVASNGGVWYSE